MSPLNFEIMFCCYKIHINFNTFENEENICEFVKVTCELKRFLHPVQILSGVLTKYLIDFMLIKQILNG